MSAKYNDSIDFTFELETVQADLQKLRKIAYSDRWMWWMQATDNNFGTQTVPANIAFQDAVLSAELALNTLASMLHEAA